MNNSDEKDDKYHNMLISSYCFCKSLYSFSFRDRVSVDIGTLNFTPRHSDKELESLSSKELEDRLDSLKKPWWNSLYERYLHKHYKRLWLIFLLFIRKDYSWNGIKLIYRTARAKTKEFGGKL